MVSITIAALFGLFTAISGAAIANRLKVVEEDSGDIVVFDAGGEEVARIQQVEQRPLDFLDQFLNKISILATVLTKPDKPQIKISNPVDSRSVIYTMDFSFDSGFQTNGIMQVNVNGRKMLKTKAGDFEGIPTYSLPIPIEGLFLQKNENLEVFFWNDGTAGRATVNISIGDI